MAGKKKAAAQANRTRAQAYRKGQEIRVRITDLGMRGEGIGRLEDGYTVFIKDAVIGDYVRASMYTSYIKSRDLSVASGCQSNDRRGCIRTDDKRRTYYQTGTGKSHKICECEVYKIITRNLAREIKRSLKYISVFWRTGDISDAGREGSKSSLFCDKKSQFFRRK